MNEIASESLKDNDWLAGFADGESCFLVAWLNREGYRSYSIQFVISLRADDVDLLRQLQAEFGGRVISRPAYNSEETHRNPQCRWRITSRNEVLGLIDYFDKHPLHGQKKHQYTVWREAAIFYYRHAAGLGGNHRGGTGRNPDWVKEAMEAYKSELERLKKYAAQPMDFNIEIGESQESLFEESEYGVLHIS